MTTTATTPGPLQCAQEAVARQDFAAAAEHFTAALNMFPANVDPPPILVLSRATVHMQLKRYHEAAKDAEWVVRLKDEQSAMELVPGCYSTRVAGASRAAMAYRALGDMEKAAVFHKIATQLMKMSATKTDDALRLKEEGNTLFRANRVPEALEKWQEGLRLDSTSVNLMTNISLAMLKLGRRNESLRMADRCVRTDPSWAKGWLRKGAALRALGKFAEAVASFQEGLRLAPEDPVLKQQYIECAKLAEKLGGAKPRGKGAFDTKMVGMMMDLRHNSMDLKAFLIDNQERSTLGAVWDASIAPLLGTPDFLDKLEKFMRLAFANYRRDMKPATPNPSFKTPPYASYVLPSHPLLTALVLHTLLSAAFPKSTWMMCWTHAADFEVLARSSLAPHVRAHRSYAAIVGSEGEVYDFLAEWAVDVGCDETTSDWLGRIVDAQTMDGGDGAAGQATVFYTCHDPLKVFEYLERFYEGLEIAENEGSLSEEEDEGEGVVPGVGESDGDGDGDEVPDDEDPDGDHAEDEDVTGINDIAKLKAKQHTKAVGKQKRESVPLIVELGIFFVTCGIMLIVFANWGMFDGIIDDSSYGWLVSLWPMQPRWSPIIGKK